jgi:hypothetical protein
MSNNYLYKIGDLVVVGKKRECGVVLSWRVNEDDCLEYEIEHKGKIKWFPEYSISHCQNDENH